MTSPLTNRELEILAGRVAPTTTFTPISETGRLVTAAADYATVVSWTVSAEALGILREISFVTDEIAITQYRLTIGGVIKWADAFFQSTNMTIPFPDTPLTAETVVLLEALSDGTNSITVDGSISGEERS